MWFLPWWGEGCKDHLPTKKFDEFAKHVCSPCLDPAQDFVSTKGHRIECLTSQCETCGVQKSKVYNYPAEHDAGDDLTMFREMAIEKRAVNTKSGIKTANYTVEVVSP